MDYIENSRQLAGIFNINRDEIQIPGSNTKIRNMVFSSRLPIEYEIPGLSEDHMIFENSRFRYPVFLPEGKTDYKNVIVLLHGLNERSWNKHLTGARFLAERTGRAVILFPLSYHINRGLPEWSDARKMSALLQKRQLSYPGIKDASVINLALSERLTEHPERFYMSGLQSAFDLIALLKSIQEGRHCFFNVGTKTDIFCYSISCMLIQSLMISNPDHILSNSRIVFFAGGSLFSHLQGVSRFIMDSLAFDAIRTFYTNVLRFKTSLTKGVIPLMMENKFGQAFKTLILPDKFRNIREKSIQQFRNNLMVIALRNDNVIPVEGIRMATGERFFRSENFKIVHFPYSYSHENPFPVLYDKWNKEVTKAFLSVFNQVFSFYAS